MCSVFLDYIIGSKLKLLSDAKLYVGCLKSWDNLQKNQIFLKKLALFIAETMIFAKFSTCQSST